MLHVALIGASGHASDVLSLIESLNVASTSGPIYSVVGAFHSDPGDMDERRFAPRGVSIMSLDTLSRFANSAPLHYVACVGYPAARRDLVHSAVVTALSPLTLVHHSAALGTGVTLGRGAVVLAQSSISPLAVIGDHAYISHGALIGHDTIIGAYSSLMPGCSVSGDCVIGEAVMIGSNATVLEKISIGDGATVGAGSVVTRNVAPGATVVGAPARVVEPR